MIELSQKMSLIAPVRKIVTFRFLSDGEVIDLLGVSEVLEYEEGEPIVSEGEVSPYFFGIIEGTMSVGVTVAEEGGEEKQVYVTSLGPGDVFGEAGIFMSVKRTATVTALGPVVAIRIHRKELVRFLQRHAEAGNKILLTIIYSLLRKLRAANQELAYERKSDIGQDEIDSMVDGLFSERDE
jgi:CRP/FNR family cyclic AMP-dependent transcriptional regulator